MLRTCIRTNLKNKGSTGKHLGNLPPLSLQRTGLTEMKISHGKRRGQGRTERLNMSLLNRDGRLSGLRVIPVSIGGDVRTTFLRINYKAQPSDLLYASLSISHFKCPKRVLRGK